MRQRAAVRALSLPLAYTMRLGGRVTVLLEVYPGAGSCVSSLALAGAPPASEAAPLMAPAPEQLALGRSGLAPTQGAVPTSQQM